ncbi:hypothetical protein K470DRAFT_254632, partial [Piedraia hortae CBS 480.64]
MGFPKERNQKALRRFVSMEKNTTQRTTDPDAEEIPMEEGRYERGKHRLIISQNFMTQVARECEKTNHHPEWSNVYNQVNVTWTTHRPRGISMKDVRMVGFCDRVAGDVGEV